MSVDEDNRQIHREDYWTEERWDEIEPGPDAPDWKVRRRHRLLVRFYGALCAFHARDDRPENDPSLATCKSSPTPVGPGGREAVPLSHDLTAPETAALPILFRLGVEDVHRAVRIVRGGGDRLDAIHNAMGRDEERIEKVLMLLEKDEVAHALRLAGCGQQSVQLGCPEDAGGCGSEENYVPIHCGSRLCEDCMNRRIGQTMEKWRSSVAGMEYPAFSTFTIENVEDPVAGTEEIVDAFAKLRRRTIPFEGETERQGSVKRWCWGSDGGKPADRWRVRLQEAGARDLAAYLESEYVRYEYEDVTGTHQGRAIPFDELVRGGLYSVDVKEVEPGEYNVHLHTVMDMPFIPQAALSAVWEDVTGDPIVDLRRIYDRSRDGVEDALMETVGYATKAPEFESLEEMVEFTTGTKGKALIHPFGDLHGNGVEFSGLLRCGECDRTPDWWEYLGTVDERRDTMGKDWDTAGENDPPSGGGGADG